MVNDKWTNDRNDRFDILDILEKHRMRDGECATFRHFLNSLIRNRLKTKG